MGKLFLSKPADMKNKFLQITAAALFAFPGKSFCQAIDAPIAFGNEICYVGTVPVTGAEVRVCAKADFDGSIIKQKEVAATTIVETDHCFANGECFSALVDNTKFQVKGFRPISATLVAGPSAPDVDMGARTIVNIAMGGKGDAANDDSMLHETIQLQLVLTEPISPGAAVCKVLLNHQSVAYAMVKGDASNVEVTDFIWSMDRKSFMLSLKFNCTMRSLGFPADGKKEVNLKGQIVRVQVVSPNVIAASN
jgi:hypothetical protein